MTDEELLDLVETKSPGELSLDEIHTLRTRLAESPTLRATFSSRLKLQTFLAEVLARIDLAPDDVLRSNSRTRPSRGTGGLLKWTAIVLLATAIVAVFGVPQFRERVREAVHQLTDEGGGAVHDQANDRVSQVGPDDASREVEVPAVSGQAKAAADRAVLTDANATRQQPDSQVALPSVLPVTPEDASKSEDSATADRPTQTPANNPAAVLAENPPALRPPPWQAASLAEPSQSLESLLYQRFDTKKVLPQAVDLHDWFDVIVGEPKGIVESRSKYGQCGAIEGILRLNAPWTDDSILRLELEAYKQLQMHFFAGDQGVTLIFHADKPERWAAYLTTRAPGRFTPQTWRLTADDCGRNRRTMISQGGPYQLRHRDGELLLTRGDIELIRAPLTNLPEDVYFQGRASIVGIDWQRARSPKEDVARPANEPAVVNSGQTVAAAEFAWQSHLEPRASLSTLPGNAIRLESKDGSKRSWSTIWRPRDNLYTIDLELEDAMPGAGIYLGDVANPKWVLRYVHDSRTGQLCLIARGNDDHRIQSFRPLHEAMLPSVGGRHWVRLVCGPSMIRWWLSADGLHWAEADPLRNPPIKLTHLGLHCASGAKCGVTLRQIRLKPLAEIGSLADPQLRRQALLPDALNDPAAPKDIATWIARITELQPPGSSLNLWRRTAAVQTLAIGCPAPLGIALLDLLLDDVANSERALDEQLRLLDEAALLADLYDNQQRVQAWVDRYHRLGLAQAVTGDGNTFSSIRAALMKSSMTTVRNFDLFHPVAIKRELVNLVYADDWSATARFCRRIRFFHLHAKVPLFEWAEMAAAKRTPGGLSEDLLTRLPETWRSLLVEHQSKDVYNVSAELQALLDSEAFEDAAQMIATLDPRELSGVAVDEQDDRLLASLPALISMASQRHPRLRTAVAEQQADLADLRLREHVALHDAKGVAMVALQFPGTQAVPKAHAWLGNRAMSSGWFESALWHYRRAASESQSIGGAEMGSRLALAEIMLGRATKHDLSPPSLGDIQLKIDEVAAIQASQRAERSMNPLRYTANGFEGSHTSTVAPTEFVVQKKARLDGSVGQEPKRVLNGNINVFNVDWVSRQLGVTVDHEQIVVSNRFQVAAYDRSSGARLWQTPQLPGRVRRSHDWSLTAMRPVLRGTRVFARQLYGDTTSLACFDRSKGQPVWVAAHRKDIDIISDPMFIQDHLVCLTMARTSQLESVVRCTEFDPATGTVWHDQDLVTLSNAWMRRQICEVQTVRDGIVAVLGGVVLSCDARGQLRWVSRQILLPPDEQPDWVTQSFAPPLVIGDAEAVLGHLGSDSNRIYVAEPGVRVLQCLDTETGQLYWSRTIPDLKRVLGVAGGCLIAHGAERLIGIEPVTGETRWQRPIEPLLHGHLCGGEHGILLARRLPTDEKKTNFVPELFWVDGKTGEETHATRLTGLEDADPRLGPMVVASGQLWTFFGRGPNDVFRDVIQLAPTATSATNASVKINRNPWQTHLDTELVRAFNRQFPDWTLIGGTQDAGTGIKPELHGEKNVLALAAREGTPIILGRSLDVPLGTQPRLRLTLGNDVKRSGQIEVRFQGVKVGQIDITPKSHTEPWKNIDIDLQDFAGETGWLTVHARFTDGKNAVLVGWRKLEVVF